MCFLYQPFFLRFFFLKKRVIDLINLDTKMVPINWFMANEKLVTMRKAVSLVTNSIAAHCTGCQVVRKTPWIQCSDTVLSTTKRKRKKLVH